MKRIHLIELHEQSWYPSIWRKPFQALLASVVNFSDPFAGSREILNKLFSIVRPREILDLCSGSGELSVHVLVNNTDIVQNEPQARIFLSDLFPNVESYRALKEAYPELVNYYPEPINVLAPGVSGDIWMMLESFHHFKPEQAKIILENAATNAQGIIILETTGRTITNLLINATLVPFMAAFSMVFKVKPFRLSNLLWGLLIPVVPLTATFDGFVSHLRTYTPEELLEITDSIGSSDFHWEAGLIAMPETPMLSSTYLIGYRQPDPSGLA